jgi:outer membrane biosynthesis protein TonB
MMFRVIYWGVIAAHFLLLIWVTLSSPTLGEKKREQHLIVKTVTPSPLLATKTLSSPAQKPKQAPKRDVKKAEQKKPSTPPPRPASPPRPKTEPKKQQTLPDKQAKAPSKPLVPQHLLRELEETIAKINENQDKISKRERSSVPQKIKPLEVDSAGDEQLLSVGPPYREVVVGYLREALHLPDYGEVKIQVTLRKDGSVERLKVLQAESERNRKYLEEHLPFLTFPPPYGLSDRSEMTFIFTFCNEL